MKLTRTETVEFHHTGRLGCCPILIDDADSPCPHIEPRYKWLGPLFWLNDLFGQWQLNRHGGVLLYVGPKLDKPIVRTFEVDDEPLSP